MFEGVYNNHENDPISFLIITEKKLLELNWEVQKLCTELKAVM